MGNREGRAPPIPRDRIDVRRALVEALQTDLRDIHRHGPEELGKEHETAVRRILHTFGLLHERRVDIQHYELNVQPGNPRKQFLINCLSQGDIRESKRK